MKELFIAAKTDNLDKVIAFVDENLRGCSVRIKSV
jgi:hypothetical protein